MNREGGGPRRPGPGRRRLSGRRRLVFLALVVILAAVFALVLALLERESGPDFPEPLPAPGGAAGAVLEDFAGAEACRECHRGQYEAWRASTHGRAGGAPAERAIVAFDGRPIRFANAVVTPEVGGDGAYVFRVAEAGQAERVFRVAGVVGGGHLVGGGTQGFFSEFPDGTLRFLPFDFHAGAGVWFCQTGGRSDEGWRPITPEMRLSDCSDWPPSRVLGDHERFPNCQGCHGSQIDLRFEPETKRYRTSYSTLSVNCEACHGPGRRHVELARSGTIAGAVDIGMAALETLSEDGSLVVCLQCHSVKERLRGGHRAGEPVERYYSLKLPLLSYRPYFPDGRIRLFAYQATHLFSDCYLNGTMTCVDCHDPHSQGYRDVWGRPLSGRFDDGQCTGCHPSKSESLERHTHHPAGSPGSRCVACHMPYLQEPDVGDALRYARSDHTIPIPRPRLDTIFGVRSACQTCHSDWPLGRIEEHLRAWHGEPKPLKANVEGLIRARGVADRSRAAELMIGPRNTYTILQLQGLAYFFLTYLSPDMPELEAAVEARLRELAVEADLDLQALALAALHLARGDEPGVREFLIERLRELGPRDAAVRDRWVWVLDWRGRAYLERGDTTHALAALRKAADVRPDDPSVLDHIGDARVRSGDVAGAIAAYRGSLAADSLQPLTLADLGFALIEAGRMDEGVDAYRRAMAMNPWEPRVLVSLGRVYLSRGEPREAIGALERAVELDPSLAEAQFILGLAYAEVGLDEEAIATLSRGLELQRDAESARALLERVRRRAAEPRR